VYTLACVRVRRSNQIADGGLGRKQSKAQFLLRLVRFSYLALDEIGQIIGYMVRDTGDRIDPNSEITLRDLQTGTVTVIKHPSSR
jgi:hypothetical protein